MEPSQAVRESDADVDPASFFSGNFHGELEPTVERERHGTQPIARIVDEGEVVSVGVAELLRVVTDDDRSCPEMW
jgi:hypothetical protein